MGFQFEARIINQQETIMSDKQAKLKEITAKKKALADEQKAIREELNLTKGQRQANRKIQAEARKAVQDQKAKLRDLSATIYKTFSTNDPKAIGELADQMMESASVLSGTIRKFAEASKDPSESEEI
jgi:hypothetical protein